MNIICFLTVKPCILTLKFCEQLQNESNYNVRVFVDDNDYRIPDIFNGNIEIIKINNKTCEDKGYKSTVMWLDNKACSRDKALYYLNINDIEYDNVWLIEEDVFIPNIETISNIDIKYPNGDLLSRHHSIVNTYQDTRKYIIPYLKKKKIKAPYAQSMISAIRCSKKLVKIIGKHAEINNDLFLDEALFNTLALQNNLDVLTIKELNSIKYKKKWTIKDIKQIGINNLYHRIKDIQKHYSYRKELENQNNIEKQSNYKYLLKNKSKMFLGKKYSSITILLIILYFNL
jgi:hypothetical protein